MQRRYHQQVVYQRWPAPAIAMLLLALLLFSCHLSRTSSTQRTPGKPARPSAATQRVVVVLGSTESDPWTAEMLNTLGQATGTEPLSKGETREGIDSFGPYPGKLGDKPIELYVALCDLSGVTDIATQEKLGELTRTWVDELHPDVVWLDGDQLQLQVGRPLHPSLPIVYSGVTIRPDLFYEEGRQVCGVLKQYSLSRIIIELLKLAPQARQIALVTDDSTSGQSRAADIRDMGATLPQGMSFTMQKPVKDWAALRQELHSLPQGVDAVLVCAMGAEGSSIAQSRKPCPAGLLKGLTQPVLTCGPTALDSAGVLSLRLKPAVHARKALDLVGQVLAGKPANTLGNQVPDDMELFQSER